MVPHLRPRDPDLHVLVYVSSATRLFQPAEIADFLDRARTRNRAQGISGLLLFCEGNFMQVLEGPRARLDALFDRIRRDVRHHDVVRLLFEPQACREFADWDMAYDDASAPDFLALTQADWHPSGVDAPPCRGRRMLTDFWSACRR